MISETHPFKSARRLCFSLMASAVWIIIGLASGGPQALGPVSTVMHTLLAVVPVVLLPSVAWRHAWSCPAAAVIGIVTVGYLVVTAPQRFAGDLGQKVAPAVWAVIQLPVIYFAYKAYKESRQA